MPNKRTGPDYLDRSIGQRTTEGQKKLKERKKKGNMHTHYGFPDTPEGKAAYNKNKKKYGLD